MKVGILIISFGTSYKDTESKNITPIINLAGDRFKDTVITSAFTSKIIINKLKANGRVVLNPLEAANEMSNKGVDNLIVQPLLFLNGNEYENKIINMLAPIKDKFKSLYIGEPLLSSNLGMENMINEIGKIYNSVGKEPILFMGHGTDHKADDIYISLQNSIKSISPNLYISTVEGSITLDDILYELKRDNIKRIHLYPLMLVSGDHARNDMAGDDEDSWKSILEKNGITAICHLNGFGENSNIRNTYISLIEDGFDSLKNN